MTNNKKYDVLVIGAGHAGLESAFAAAKKGLRTGIITLSENTIAKMPCNPSIGGPAKGIVTREIAALGGMQAQAADANQIQIKILGTSKGPGVWALRAQIDKIQYHEWFKDAITKQENLDLIIGEASEILYENNIIIGVVVDQVPFFCSSLVITSGTYLQSKTYRGNVVKDEGPDEGKYSKNLSFSLVKMGFELIRLKTGTPPRIYKDTIDYSEMEEDYGSSSPLYFDDNSNENWDVSKLEPCYLLYTNKEVHDIIDQNLTQSAMYSGLIQSIGPRYCPSIEDKVHKFSNRERHQLFLEPESKFLDTMYLGGFSTSMPVEIQDKMIRSLPGLKNCSIQKYAYAIEYDAIIPTQLYPSLMSKKYQGLFFAGQINGTSGYEEAAGQGLVAGINAANYVLKQEPLILKRTNSYIGVMIDDIVTKGITEPYRLLTSRAEHRLYLRNDNAYERLAKIGYESGVLAKTCYDVFLKEQQIIDKTIAFLNSKIVGQVPVLKEKVVKNNVTLFEYLKRPEITLDDILIYLDYNQFQDLNSKLKQMIEIKVKFAGYIKLQEEKIAQYQKIKDYSLAVIENYKDIPNLSLETIDKLNKIKPLFLSQAQRISGITMDDIVKIKYYLDIHNYD